MPVIDRPWAIVYGSKCKLGVGLMYGLGKTREDAWQNAILVMNGSWPCHTDFSRTKESLKKKGMVVRKVEVRL